MKLKSSRSLGDLPVYDIEVEDNHNFSASTNPTDQPIVVHNCCGDNPIKGLAANAWLDASVAGEGENVELRLCLDYLKKVKENGMDREAWLQSLTNPYFAGVYNPTLTLFEYADKEVTFTDHTGAVVDRRVYKQAGNIYRISMLDHETKTKHVLAGPESEEFMDMQVINDMIKLRHPDGKVTAQFDEAGKNRYVTINEKPTLKKRAAQMGFGGITPEDRAKTNPKNFGTRVPKVATTVNKAESATNSLPNAPRDTTVD